MRHLLARLIPFIFLGIALVALAFGIMLLVYLFFFGAIIGLILFAVTWVKERYFSPKKPRQIVKRGRTIESDDWKSH